MRTCLWILLLSFIALTGLGHPTSVAPDGMLMVQGERTFVLGLYQTAENDAFAEEVKAAGFNLIRVDPTAEQLDRAERAGLHAWIPAPGWAIETDKQEEAFRQFIRAHRGHPALAIWEGPDEILWNVWWNRWNQANARWNELEAAIDAFSGSEEEKQTLREKTEKWKRYRQSARYAEAEELEASLRQQVGLPPSQERLSDWSNHLPGLLQQVRRGTACVREEDPHHAIWFNHAPRNTMQDLHPFGFVADLVGCDIYPVPADGTTGHSDLADMSLSSVGAYTRRMAESAPGKGVWMVLQGFGWNDLAEGKGGKERPRPTYEQSRFMAYDAIANGARGILYWGTFALEADSGLWKDLKQLATELHSIHALLSAPDDSNPVTAYPRWGSAEKGLVWKAKAANGELALIVVNEAADPIAFEIAGADAWNGKTVEVLNEPETLEVKDGCIQYGLPGMRASVLVIRK